MTETRTTGPAATPAAADTDARGLEPKPDSRPRHSRVPWTIAGVALLIALGVAVAALLRDTGSAGWQTADVGAQGGQGSPLANDGARLERRDDRLAIEMEVPTPAPGTYEYPTGDMIPPWVESHPPISPGASDAPEVFTLWLIVFNEPDLCRDGECNADDLTPDAPARGGVYQPDGRIADDNTLRYVGNVRIGQEPLAGAPLDNPHGAMVHAAIAPHGRALPGGDGWIQLNSPVGNPTLWWTAVFPPDP